MIVFNILITYLLKADHEINFLIDYFQNDLNLTGLVPVLTASNLYWDAGLDPVLAQVAVSGDVAVVVGDSQQEDDRQDVVSNWNGEEKEHEEDSPLEWAPGPQKRD